MTSLSMTQVLTVIGDPATSRLDDTTAAAATEVLHGAGAETGAIDWLNPRVAFDLPFSPSGEKDLTALRQALRERLAAAPFDIALQTRDGRRKALLLADMESTIIAQEMLDELGDMLGLGPRISAVTEKAMRGELDFAAALRERVALLAGVRAETLREVSARMTLNPGARSLVRSMRAQGGYTVLVSGGFSIFTSQIQQLCGFDEERANRLLFDGDRLTGEVAEPLLDRDAKAQTLAEVTGQRGLPASATICVGDGANDLAMIRAAGLGVAYRPKPVLRQAADVTIDHGDLTALLYLQGYRRGDLLG